MSGRNCRLERSSDDQEGETMSHFRYEYGGDEFVFVELSEGMDLNAYFRAMAITDKLRQKQMDGIIDICPANASYMIRVDPLILHPDRLIAELKMLEAETSNVRGLELSSRIVDVPVLFDDPWTYETVMKFRDRHQDPASTDIEYTMRLNGIRSKEELIERITGNPFLVLMVAFVPGLPTTYQLVPRERQMQAPKYLRPRTFTYERTLGFGGAFACIYPVDGAGGYQLIGIAAAPVFNKEQNLADFKSSMVFPRPGDIFRYRSVSSAEYEEIRKSVEDGSFQYRTDEIRFSPEDILLDPDRFADEVTRRLAAHD
jgi:urea carboxylase